MTRINLINRLHSLGCNADFEEFDEDQLQVEVEEIEDDLARLDGIEAGDLDYEGNPLPYDRYYGV